MKNFTHYIFDFDGTLADSQVYWQLVCGEILQSRGYAFTQEDVDFCMTHPPEERAVYFCEKHGLTPEEYPQRPEILEWIDRFLRTRLEWKEGAEEFLQRARAMGKKTVLFSATPIELLNHALERLDARRYFDEIVSTSQVGVGKGNPESYRYCLDLLGITPDRAVMFEDAPYSMETAKKVGLYVVAVREPAMEYRKEEIMRFCDEFVDVITDWSEKE